MGAWIYPTDLSASRPILEYTLPNSYAGVHLWIAHAVGGFVQPGTLYANIRDIVPVDRNFNSLPNIVHSNEWQHVALTYDATSGDARLYWNGTVVAAVNFGTNFIPQTSYPLYLGYRPPTSRDAAVEYRFLGQMDEVEIFNRALPQSELRAIYLAGSAGKCGAQTFQFSRPISWWPAEGNANDIIDSNSGTLSGGVTFAGGIVGRAFNFDGTGEVRINNNTNLNFGTNLSMEAWVFPTVRDGEMDTILYKEADTSNPEQYAMAIKGPLNVSCPGGTITNGHFSFALAGVAGLPNEFCGWVDGGGIVPTNQWTHLAVTFDGRT